jgi:TetR/AcrR family transcriptional repressor of nem operon
MFEEGQARLLHETEGREVAQGLSAYIDFYLSKKHRDARNFGCPIAALSSDLPRLGNAARVQFASGVQRQIEALAERLATLGQTHAEATARSMVAELVGALSLARIEPVAKKSDAMLSASRHQLKQRLGLEQRA